MTVIASGIILYRLERDQPQLLLLRNRDGGHWGFPKGRRDPDDEHEVATALREVGEETGYTDVMLHPTFRAQVEYIVRNEGPEYPKRVTYFMGVAPRGAPRLSDEHLDFVWADGSEAARVLPYGQLRDLAAAALDTIRRT